MAGIRSSKAQWRFVIRNIQWNQFGYKKANLVVYCHYTLITHLAPSTDLGYQASCEEKALLFDVNFSSI
jgi:hypothetical protein